MPMSPGRIGRRVAAPLAVLALAPWLVLALWSRPSADDFCYFAFVRAQGWLDAQLFVRQSLGGRYTATALLTGIGWLTDRLDDPAVVYAGLGWLGMLAILWLAWRSVGLLLPHLAAADRLIVAALVEAAFLSTLPRATDALFWGAVVAIYLTSLLLAWYFMLRLIAAATGRPAPGPAGVAWLAALAFLGAGCNELTAPIL